MSKIIKSLALLFLLVFFVSSTEKLVLRSEKSAKTWEVAYPVGNGRIGALSFGYFPKEKILINEETIWGKGPKRTMPPNSKEVFKKVRELEKKGDYQGADRVFQSIQDDNFRPYSYQYAGYLTFHFLGKKQAKVSRKLDLKTAITTSTYDLGNEKITQEVFVSTPFDIVAIKLSTTSPKGLDVMLNFEDIKIGKEQDTHDIISQVLAHSNTLSFEGAASWIPADKRMAVAPTKEKRGTSFYGQIRVFPKKFVQAKEINCI